MASAPSRLASLFWSCFSFRFYPRVAEGGFGRTVGYLVLLACVAALAVTVFFASQVLPALRATARAVPELVLSGGRLVVAPESPGILYDDGPHGLLLVRLAVDQEPPPAEEHYDAIVTLRANGVDLELCGHTFRAAWPSQVALEIQPLDAIAFMDSWWLFLCMVTFAGAAVWFFVTRLAHALLGSLLLVLLAGPSRGTGFGAGFNIAAYALTPGTLLMIGLVWANALYRFPAALLGWNWALYLAVSLIYLLGAIGALPARPANPWARRGAE